MQGQTSRLNVPIVNVHDVGREFVHTPLRQTGTMSYTSQPDRHTVRYKSDSTNTYTHLDLLHDRPNGDLSCEKYLNSAPSKQAPANSVNINVVSATNNVAKRLISKF